jgi:hypothetical protein
MTKKRAKQLVDYMETVQEMIWDTTVDYELYMRRQIAEEKINEPS